MKQAFAEPVSAAELIKLYGKIGFDWNIETDHIEWQGPINKLFGSDLPLSTGSSYLNRLTNQEFWRRLSQIDDREGDSYTSVYFVTLPDGAKTPIKEEASIIRDSNGNVSSLDGSIRILEEYNEHLTKKDLSGYDSLTGFPEREVVLENLYAVVEQTKGNTAPGGFLVFCIDRISSIYFTYGLEGLKEAFRQVGTNLKEQTRFNDTIGRISGCCFGSTLKDMDEWGVFQAANRLSESCKDIQVKTDQGTFTPDVSIGGSAFQNDITPVGIIHQAELGVFEMQNMKGAGVTIKQATGGAVSIERPDESKVGKRRISDIKKNK